MNYDWPGNLKELEILLDDIMSMVTTEDQITYELLPIHFKWKMQAYDTSTKSPTILWFIMIKSFCHLMII